MHRIFWQRENPEGNQKSDYQWRGQYRDCMEYRWSIFQVRWMLMEFGVSRKYGTPFFCRHKYCFQYTAIAGIMESDIWGYKKSIFFWSRVDTSRVRVAWDLFGLTWSSQIISDDSENKKKIKKLSQNRPK